MFDHEVDGGLPVREAVEQARCIYKRYQADSEDEGLDHGAWLRFKLDLKQEASTGRSIAVVITPPCESFQMGAYRSTSGPDRYGHRHLTGEVQEAVRKGDPLRRESCRFILTLPVVAYPSNLVYIMLIRLS